MNDPYEINLPYRTELTWGSLLSRTYGLYRDHFWTFFRTGLPVALLVYVFKLCYPILFSPLFNWFISRPAGQRTANSHLLAVLLALSLGFVQGAFYWLISTVFFAAVTARVIGGQQDTPLFDAYSPVRPRIGSLLIVGLITWGLFFIARTLCNWLLFSALDRLHIRYGFILRVAIFSIPLLLIAGLLSRLALAVPELIDNSGISVREAIRGSVSKTEDWEPFFSFFLAKSAIVGYAVYWLTQYVFDQVWRRTLISGTAYYWTTWAVYVCLFAILESPLFIAFSVLYDEANSRQEGTMAAPAIG